eukprot:TRINITY_DN70959_c1_g1_i1.p1 TRINITY_DN70959_c1_g1~~TRINITY_DN70959_c1_g1_i1.p1  ORF type:complete len:340 (-),score=93.98 TRINITY_DN70959_c1_g1_i1:92-1111(-)
MEEGKKHLEVRPLGSQGLMAPQMGLGTMGMTAFYVPDPAAIEEEALATIERGFELGLNFLDTAYIYAHPSGAHNEALVGKAIAKHEREKWIIATKFGVFPDRLDSSPEAIRKQLDESLARLGTDYVDLYYQHRQDPKTPIEDVMRTLAELHAEGKVRYVGLSEVTPSELRRAHAVFPVSAIQMEWSLQTRDIESEVVPTARELGIGIVAYSPLARGFLSRKFKAREDLEKGDWRSTVPRFADGNFEKNAMSAAKLEEIAKRKGCTAGQLALAWLWSHGKDVFPIPGCKAVARLEENIGAARVQLSEEEVAEIEEVVSVGAGERYEGMGSTFNSRMDKDL